MDFHNTDIYIQIKIEQDSKGTRHLLVTRETYRKFMRENRLCYIQRQK
jgi:hypothetical protein